MDVTAKTAGSEYAGTVSGDRNRWIVLGLLLLCMMMVGAIQYGWTLFVGPLDAKFKWGRAYIQWGFTILILVEAFSMIVTGYLIDKLNAKVMCITAAVLITLGMWINSTATSLGVLYLGCGIAGVSVGIVSALAPNIALKWFPNNKGLATGTVVTGFVLGSLVTVLWMNGLIQTVGYETAFVRVGLLQGAIILVSAFFLRAPIKGEVPEAITTSTVKFASRDFTPKEAVSSGAFWVLFAIFTLVATGGLMVTAQFAPIANDLKVANIPVTLLGFTMAALPLAIVFDRIMNGVCRPVFGALSDRIGRENTMFLAFLLEAIAVMVFIHYAHDPLLFVLLSGLIFFAWGEIFSLMPTTTSDIFGTKNTTTIYGFLYAAKGIAAIGTPLANILVTHTGSWLAVFYVVAAMDLAAALLALFVLPRMRARIA